FGGYLLLSQYEWPYPLGMAAVLAFMLFVGWATERIAVRPLVEKGAPLLAPILALLGMLVVFREAISVSFPPDPHPVPFPFGLGRLELGPLGGSYQSFFIIGTTLLVFVVAWLFFERTVAGKSFEAVALHRRAAALMGINLSRVTALSFAAGAGIAGLAGLLVSPHISAHYLLGIPLALLGFPAAKTPRCGFASRPPYQGVKPVNAIVRWLGAALVLSAAAFFMSDYHNDVYRKLMLWVTLALGYNFLFGVCGQVAFSHFAFY